MTFASDSFDFVSSATSLTLNYKTYTYLQKKKKKYAGDLPPLPPNVITNLWVVVSYWINRYSFKDQEKQLPQPLLWILT